MAEKDSKKDSKLDLEINKAFVRMDELVKKMQSEIKNSKDPSGRGKEEIGNDLTLLSVAELDDDLERFAKTKNLATKNLATKNLATKNLATKNLATKDLATKDLVTKDLVTKFVKKFYPSKISLYKRYVDYKKYYYKNAVIPTEEEWQSYLNYFKNLVYVMQENGVGDRQIKTYIKQLKELPDKYDEKFKKAFKDKIKDKAPEWLWKFVIKAPSIINAIAKTSDDSLLIQNLGDDLPSVGSDNLLLVPPKLWLELTIILNSLVVEIKLWIAEKVEEAEHAERMNAKQK